MGLMARFKSTATFMSLTVNSNITVIGSDWPSQSECEDSAFVDTVTPGEGLHRACLLHCQVPELHSSSIILLSIVIVVNLAIFQCPIVKSYCLSLRHCYFLFTDIIVHETIFFVL